MSAPTTSQVRPFAAVPVGVTAGVVGLVHLVAAVIYPGRYFDEALMLSLGRNHLDWGSADQPPLTPAIAALADAVAPDSLVALRIVPVLATTASVLVTALIARELGGGRRAQTLAAIAAGTGIWTSGLGHVLVPGALEPVGWLTLSWLLARWVRVRDDRLLLAIGPVLGLAALTKFQVIGLGAVLLVALAVAGPRSVLRRPALWGGVVVGAVIAAPTLLWQAAHGWPQMQMAGVVAEESETFGGRPMNAALLLLGAGVLGVVLTVAGVVGAARDPRLRPYRFLALTGVVLWVVFAVAPGRMYYLAGYYGVLAALGAVAFQHRREDGHARLSWMAWPGVVLAVVAAGATLPEMASSAPPELPEQIAASVDRASATLSPEQRSRAVVVTADYTAAAYLDVERSRPELPPVYSVHRAYGYLDPPPDDRDVVLFLGEDPAVLAPAVTGLQRVDSDDEYPVWVGTGPHRPWSQAWPSLRTLR
ncbi:ArnT family glycosyltransferase [Pseudonocardia phyllosphaerae]|uniref:ArnT family glycosyltransferase n=1 Tax=Pseudonocardia phyllosphaerae TaxID=3390502 RepID=UPI0039795928